MLVRGGDLDADILSEDAVLPQHLRRLRDFGVRRPRRHHRGTRPAGATGRFDRLSLLTVRDVLAAGMRLEPTGRNPRHFTVGFDDLQTGVQRLVSCAHRVVPNAYHDA